MNVKRYIFAAVVLFLFMFGYEALVHGFLLKNTYSETASIWRSYDQMMAYAPFSMGIKVLISLWFTFIFTRFYKEGGWKNGLLFGVYLGILSGIQAAGAYYYLPISAMLAIYWLLAYLIESVIGGFLIGLIYRR